MAVGHQWELVRSYETEQIGSDGSSSNSSGTDACAERVVAIRPEGIELEYDIAPDADEEERQRQWSLPARVLRLPDGSLRLLNRGELEARLDDWLKRANWNRDMCGKWIFTWNAFRIECDPESGLA